MRSGAWLLVALTILTTSLAARAPRPADGDPPTAAATTLFRVFLKDGSSLASLGEYTVVGDRVIFSMPVGAVAASGDTPLQLINIPADNVDWSHTNTYAESARAANYYASRAQDDYAKLASEVADALNAVSIATDASTRVAIVENARKMLADWPASHYYYNQTEVLQLLSFLDEALANLQATRDPGRFSLSLVTNSGAVPKREPLLPPPTLKEVVEQVLIAAGLANSPMEKSSLLSTALDIIRGGNGQLPADWAASTTTAVRAELATSVQVERDYLLMSQRLTHAAGDLARQADVRGIERLLDQIRERDRAMGGKRPDIVASLNVAVQEQLTMARRLQLERDRWNLRVAAFRRYYTALAATFERFTLLKPPLDDIRALAGSTPSTLQTIDRLTTEIVRSLAQITPPVEMESAHSLLVSAGQLADSAGRIRKEAAETASIDRAWDASAAAAGSIMLISRGQAEIQARLRMPQLQP
ncbi:MAG TPA: hypothetical protein VJP86_04420 [Vicinamibacterales bacterium]|jgi:hypothetical protein|nr:hypothetical protein [Vicinamibacterales bacterium]